MNRDAVFAVTAVLWKVAYLANLEAMGREALTDAAVRLCAESIVEEACRPNAETCMVEEYESGARACADCGQPIPDSITAHYCPFCGRRIVGVRKWE